LKQLWRVKLGPGYSGPIVVGDHVFVTETRDKTSEVVRCLQRNTGSQIWETEWKGAMRVPFFAASNGSWIRSTPSYSDGRLYVAGMREALKCIDSKTGKVIWSVNFVKKFGTPLPAFGFVCSPLVVGDFLYTQAAGAVVKIDKHTGRVVWRTFDDGGGMHGSAFSSPVWHALFGQNQLVVQTRTTLAGLDPADGTELWSEEIPAFRGMNIVTPSIFEDSVFTSSYGGKSLRFVLSANSGSIDVREVWTNKAQGYMSSPVVIDGHVYLHLRNQRFTCIDLATGETKWTTTPFGKYWSMIVNGDRILALDQKGELLLIHASPEKFNLIDTRKISDEETWAHLAVAGKTLFVRELNAIVAFTWE
jgi:outer membrane protein assembly factor BamB